jgi:hypothetical protein
VTRVGIVNAAAERRALEASDPLDYQRFSIAIYGGASPFDLRPLVAPALTRDDVSDVPALYVADPFLLRDGEGWHLLFEVWNSRENKGEIGLATSDDGRVFAYQRIVLAEKFHLSYPYAFQWADEWWLVPESFQGGGVRLYRGDPAPGCWRYEATLIEAPYAVDASPFRFLDRWWLFVETGAAHDVLRLYHADELLGPWREHPRSPVVQGDATRSRPAGRVLVDGGRIIRFAQDCGGPYGRSVRAFEITRLTRDDYRERPLGANPLLAGTGTGWNADGMHHLDAQRLPDGSWVASVDGWHVPELRRTFG